ncbi:formin-B-like isoform X2 [Dermacentor silvarum]|nr:formin-B-like isoform X2 [Dermacentor silvarum]XP_049526583.1 formin-B-like isoform X2 [Dermacentor silvarum]
MRCYMVALSIALLMLLAISTTSAGPCPLPACQQPGQPVCSNPATSCNCRCNNSGTQPRPPVPSNGHPPPPPRPCGGGAGHKPNQAAGIVGTVTYTGK